MHSYLGLQIMIQDGTVEVDMSFSQQKVIAEYPIQVTDRTSPKKPNAFMVGENQEQLQEQSIKYFT